MTALTFSIIGRLCWAFASLPVMCDNKMMLSLPEERYQGRQYIKHGDSPLFTVWHIQSRQSSSTVKHAQIIPYSTQLRVSRSIMRPEDRYGKYLTSIWIPVSYMYMHHKHLRHPLMYTYAVSVYMMVVPVYYPTPALYLNTKTQKVIDVRIAQ